MALTERDWVEAGINFDSHFFALEDDERNAMARVCIEHITAASHFQHQETVAERLIELGFLGNADVLCSVSKEEFEEPALLPTAA